MDAVAQPQWWTTYLDRAFFGAVLVLSLVNGCFYFLSRERYYLFFSIYTLFSAFYVFDMVGYTLEAIFPGRPWMASALAWIALAGLLVSFAEFSICYFGLGKARSLMKNLIRVNAVWLFGSAVGGIVAFRGAGQVTPFHWAALLGTISLFILLLIVGVAGHAKNRATSRNYLLANAIFFVGGALFGSSYLVDQHSRWFTSSLYAAQLGIVIQQVIISIGMARQAVQLKADLYQQEIEAQKREKELLANRKAELEKLVDERTRQLQQEKHEVERLLLNILPRDIVDEYRREGRIRPRSHESISIMFTDFKGFTQTAALLPVQQLVAELNHIFEAFDAIIEKHGLEKIKTIGDSYMVAGGLPRAMPNHAVACVRAACEMLAHLEEHNRGGSLGWQMRVGIHTGTVVAGVVGKNKFTYDAWGDAVNIASRMEGASEPGKVNISSTTFALVKDYYRCRYRGWLDLKGKGQAEMYFVEAPVTEMPGG